jgi:hypothetical protein
MGHPADDGPGRVMVGEGQATTKYKDEIQGFFASLRMTNLFNATAMGTPKKDRKLGSFRYPRVVRVKDLVFGEVAA